MREQAELPALRTRGRKRATTGAVLVVVGLLGTAVALRSSDDDGETTSLSAAAPSQQASSWTAELREQNRSGQFGTVLLTETADGRTNIDVTLANPPSTPLPAHIHVGTCAAMNPQPKFVLTSVERGRSVSIVPVALQELLDGKFSINVRRTGTGGPMETSVSCGEIVGG